MAALDPPTKENLESRHFTEASPAIQARLTSVLRSDAAHVGTFSPPSEAIELIKQALNKAQPKIANMKPITDPKNVFGKSTADAVLAYKSVNGIVRSGQNLDSIIGRMTLARLDSEMKNMEATPVAPVVPVPVNTAKPIDLFIQIHGINPADGRSGTETTDDPFGNIQAIRSQVETEDYKKKRELRVINFYGAPSPRDPVSKILQKVDEALAASGPGGKIVILGSSVGGKNAAKLAASLQSKASLTYVALLDGGFDNAADADLRAGIKAIQADSFFESMSNDWADLMGFVEFHGQAAGTVSTNVESMSAGVYSRAANEIAIIRKTPGHDKPGGRAAAAFAARIVFKTVHDQAVSDGTKRAVPKAITALRATS